jgi:hypothetical protein
MPNHLHPPPNVSKPARRKRGIARRRIDCRHPFPGTIGVEVLGSLAVSQLVYLAVSLTADLTRSTRLVPQIQTVIGQELRVQLEVPRRLSPELAALVSQLQNA